MSHHYDGHKTICSPEDKAPSHLQACIRPADKPWLSCQGVAGRLGGHTWNILTNSILSKSVASQLGACGSIWKHGSILVAGDKHELYLTQARSILSALAPGFKAASLAMTSEGVITTSTTKARSPLCGSTDAGLPAWPRNVTKTLSFVPRRVPHSVRGLEGANWSPKPGEESPQRPL